MNRIEVNAGEAPLPPWAPRAEEYILKVLDRVGRDGWDLSVLFCDDAYIRSLNARFRGMDEATDVLSFALGETSEDAGIGKRYLPGDIVISLETLAENARYFKVSEDEELRRLLVHGVLHLDGLDHGAHLDPAGDPMLRLQEQILTELSGEHILPSGAFPAKLPAEEP
ncbi:MAG: rRNA maturation RNase YbeY [Spirochaetaceae bacterium]|jgi:probable rRNA maturation factor|nr:rRNA maturation RNase YbeY [Spirochaetaceae bacterium]